MHVALVCPEMHGHLNPMSTLGAALDRRGHRVTVVGFPLAERTALRCGLGFRPIGVKEYADGEIDRGTAKLAEMSGLAAVKLTIALLRRVAEISLRDLPDAMRAEHIDAVVTDQVSPAGGCAADLLGLPFAVACNALAMYQEPVIPPAVTAWRYHPGPLARLRNRLGYWALNAAFRPFVESMNDFRRAHNLPLRVIGRDRDYALAHVAQQPAFFDYPRERLPPHVHFTAPWHAHGRDAEVAFPFDTLGDRPLVYASLGTMQNGLMGAFAAILEGCATLPVRVVLSLGRREATWDGPVPANAVVVPFAPQLELVKRATVVITHAGLNTTLETLAAGKPMLCLPVTNDQPGVAARVAWLGAGEVMPPKRATAERVRAAVERLLNESSFRQKAEECRDRMAKVDGPAVAAEVVERALTSGKRVERR
jgi:zeaxanthin glucosyltransferase